MNAAFDRSSLDTSRVLRTIARMLRGLEFADHSTEIEVQDIARRLDGIAGGAVEELLQVD